MTTLNFPHQDDNHWLTIEVGGVEHPQYPSPLEVKMLIEEAVRKALQNVPLGFVRQWINEDRTLPNQKLVTEADIQAFINIALTSNHQD